MKRLLDLKSMCEMISVSPSRYHEMKKPGTKWFDPDLPKPIDVFGDSKKRFYSEDIERYIELKISKIAA